MALRLPSPLIASQMWDVQRRRRGSAPAMPWPAGYVPLTARICSHLKYWGLSTGEDAPAEDGKLWISAWTESEKNQLHAATRDKRLTLPACDEVWFDDRALGAFSLRTVIHWVGGASGTSRRLRVVVVEERNVLFTSFRNSGDQTIHLPGMAPGSDGLLPVFS
ncbi:hypothetical protein B0H14DRAFT_2734419 [Mycena olivaceomarginata]|nr:hypothetical protein B0H14DRAFT_2734419 [Mycena olivaceomarginata]